MKDEFNIKIMFVNKTLYPKLCLNERKNIWARKLEKMVEYHTFIEILSNHCKNSSVTIRSLLRHRDFPFLLSEVWCVVVLVSNHNLYLSSCWNTKKLSG